MKIYLLKQHINWNNRAYRGAIVIAENERNARLIHPDGDFVSKWWLSDFECIDWALPEELIVEYLGETAATKERVVLVEYSEGGPKRL